MEAVYVLKIIVTRDFLPLSTGPVDLSIWLKLTGQDVAVESQRLLSSV